MANLILYEQYIRDQSVINNNVDIALLRPLIFMIQDRKLQPILGTDLYQQVLLQSTPPTTLTTANTTLVNTYILPMLHWYLVAECAVTLKFRLMNKGVQVKSGDNSQPADTDDILFMQARYESIAQGYAEDMRKYIVANPTLYPAYFTNGTYDKMFPEKSAWRSGWFLPGFRSGVKDYSNVNKPSENPIWPD